MDKKPFRANFNEEYAEDTERAPQYGDEKESVMELERDDVLINHDEPIDPAFNRRGEREDEEFAQEMTLDSKSLRHEPIKSKEKETDMQEDVRTGMGWFAIVLSVLSFFMMPVILGAAGIITGFIAKRRGADTLGNTAIIAGAVAIVITLFIAPFFG